MGEEPSAHADPAMNPPNRQLDAFAVEGLLPGEDVLVDTIDESAVQIEYERGSCGHSELPSFSPTPRQSYFVSITQATDALAWCHDINWPRAKPQPTLPRSAQCSQP